MQSTYLSVRVSDLPPTVSHITRSTLREMLALGCKLETNGKIYRMSAPFDRPPILANAEGLTYISTGDVFINKRRRGKSK